MKRSMAVLALVGVLGFGRIAQGDDLGTHVDSPGTESVPQMTVFEGDEHPSAVSFAAVSYYVWYQYPGGRWNSFGPFFSYYDANTNMKLLIRGGARAFISNRPT